MGGDVDQLLRKAGYGSKRTTTCRKARKSWKMGILVDIDLKRIQMKKYVTDECGGNSLHV